MDQGSHQWAFGANSNRSPVRNPLAVPNYSTTALPDSNVSPRSPALGLSLSQNFQSSSRRMVPRNELELSRPAIARAEKDGDDPTSSSSRRRLSHRGHSSTPITLTRLFAVQAPTSPTQSRPGSFYKRPKGAALTTGGELTLCIRCEIKSTRNMLRSSFQQKFERTS